MIAGNLAKKEKYETPLDIHIAATYNERAKRRKSEQINKKE